jgi:patatin-like phospholipase/acyl hydrolase
VNDDFRVLHEPPPDDAKSYLHKVRAPGPKRMLSLDGGGIRGVVTLEILFRLEELLRAARGGNEDFVLADYFDYVAGTSTGAIIATCIAKGWPVERIRRFYVEGGKSMFKRAALTQQHLNRYVTAPLEAVMKRELGEDTIFGDPSLQTLLLIVMRNHTSNSPWPLSNNPYARYNNALKSNCNLKVPLWQLVRASTAAPTFFPPEKIKIGTWEPVFQDGAVTVYNNPAFILFMMATLQQYRLGWKAAEDEMLLVSIGTGTVVERKIEVSQMNLLHHAKSVPSALINAALVEQDTLCRMIGKCTFGAEIDREIGTLIDEPGAGLAAAQSPFGEKKFTYVRYSPELTPAAVDPLDLSGILANLGLPEVPHDAFRLDGVKYIELLQSVGKHYARNVSLEHLGALA